MVTRLGILKISHEHWRIQEKSLLQEATTSSDIIMNHLFVSAVCMFLLSILITSARPPLEGTNFELYSHVVYTKLISRHIFSSSDIQPLSGCPDTDPICPEIASKILCADIATKMPYKLVVHFYVVCPSVLRCRASCV